MLCPPSWSRCSWVCLALYSRIERPTVTDVILRCSLPSSRSSTCIGPLTPTLCHRPWPSPHPQSTGLTLLLTGLLKWIKNPTGGLLLLVPSGGRCQLLPLTITRGQLS